MTEMWVRAVLPEAIKKRALRLAQVRNAASFGEMMPLRNSESDPVIRMEDSPELIELLEKSWKIIFTVDGCWQQIDATYKELNDRFNSLGCECMKFAAASTMVQQPNDVGRMHCNMHAYYKSPKYLTQKTWHVPMVMKPMEDVLRNSGLDNSSFLTYWKALSQLPDCLSKCCSLSTVVDGFKKSGIWPIDHAVIMSGWAGWSNIPEDKAKVVLSKIPALAELAKKGRLFDSEIEAPFEGIFEFQNDSRKLDNCALNHGRCIWTNNKVVMEAYDAKQRENDLEQIKKDNAYMERQYRMENPEAAAQDDAMVAKRNAPLVDDAAVARDNALLGPLVVLAPKETRCSNPTCSSSGTLLARKSWSGCRKKKCRLLFCTEDCCVAMSVSHQSSCTK